MAGTASRSSRRAATQAASDPKTLSTAQSIPDDLFLSEDVEPLCPAPEAVSVVPEPSPAQERQYALEIRLANAALSGDSAYHVSWPESRVRALLAGEMTWIPAPVRPHLPGQAPPLAARYVYIQNIAEIVIHGWPQD